MQIDALDGMTEAHCCCLITGLQGNGMSLITSGVIRIVCTCNGQTSSGWTATVMTWETLFVKYYQRRQSQHSHLLHPYTRPLHALLCHVYLSLPHLKLLSDGMHKLLLAYPHHDHDGKRQMDRGWNTDGQRRKREVVRALGEQLNELLILKYLFIIGFQI